MKPERVVGDQSVGVGCQERVEHARRPGSPQIEIEAAFVVWHHDELLIHDGIMPHEPDRIGRDLFDHLQV